MVMPIGATVNAGAIVAGSLVGMFAGGLIPEKLRASLFQVMGLCALVIGLQMAFRADNMMLVIIASVLGIVTGELICLEDKFAGVGDRLKALVRSKNSRFTDGLVSCSVFFCVGAMALVGALEEGLGLSRDVILNKAILDFCMSMLFASVSGSGVLFSAVPVLLYEGGLTILAGGIAPYLTESIKSTLISCGGLMVVGIGTNLMGIKSIPLSNMVPGLAYAIILGAIF